MTKKESILLSDVSVNGDILEKENLKLDCKVTSDVSAKDVETFSNSYVKGNIKAQKISIGGKTNGNIIGDLIKLKKTADVEGVLNQKKLSVEEGASLKIKTETYK